MHEILSPYTTMIQSCSIAFHQITTQALTFLLLITPVYYEETEDLEGGKGTVL